MKKNKTNKKVSENVMANWFDSENARLIILCATLGIFGAHKFAQHKTGQGILFLLLDITIFGMLVSLIWAFLDLIFLTTRPNNKPGNMILGVFFIVANLAASMIISSADLFLGTKHEEKIIVQNNEEFAFGEQLICVSGDKNIAIDVIADSKKADLIIDTNIITLPIKVNSNNIKMYEGYWSKIIGKLIDSTNPNEKYVIKIVKTDKNKYRVNVTGNLDGDVAAEYSCGEIK